MDFIHDKYFIDFAIKLCVSTLCGAIFGLERQLRGKPIGVRTCILISVGTTLFVTLGSDVATPNADPTRVLGQIVTGIGFLGGGAILSHRGHVHGITSAAIIWLIAAVGAAVGLKLFAIAIFATVFAIIVLLTCQKVEHSVKALQKGVHKINGMDGE